MPVNKSEIKTLDDLEQAVDALSLFELRQFARYVFIDVYGEFCGECTTENPSGFSHFDPNLEISGVDLTDYMTNQLRCIGLIPADLPKEEEGDED